MPAQIAKIVTNLSLDKAFDYFIPEHLRSWVRVGARVQVPFGKAKSYRTGYVVALAESSDRSDLKSIAAVEGAHLHIPDALVKLAEWMAQYYCCPREQAVRTVMPAVVRGGKIQQKQEKVVTLIEDEDLKDVMPDLEGRAPKQAEVLRALVRHRRQCTLSNLKKAAGVTASPVYGLAKKGLVKVEDQTVTREPQADDVVLPTEHLALTEAQQQTLDMILDSIRDQKAETILIRGVTGSGKTEVYLQAIAECLANDQSAIVLVPEISLTPQTTERFRSRFGNEVSVLHSGLSDGERFDQWTKLHTGSARVAVGARSALFAPVQNLGLIVVDEEHEGTYKQEEAPRYHARDVAVVRGKQQGATVVLGTATPSMESYYNTQRNKYRLATLPERIDQRRMPHMEVVDMRAEAVLRGGAQIFSRRLEDLIKDRLANGSQTILFLNRRGYATQMMCTKCGFVATCENCDLAFTYHRRDAELTCHLCGEIRPAPSTCPSCGDQEIRYSGIGTEKVEAAARARFPYATIGRMDSDSMTRKDSYNKTLNAFRSGRIHILIGTQMIAKGLHFPNVTLVGIVFADLGLHVPDFRAGERTFQLLTQVAGRAGRGEESGHVIVQSYTPYHAALQYAMDHDYESFYNEEMEIRQALKFPPAKHMIIVHFRGENEAETRSTAENVVAELQPLLPDEADVSPPMPSPRPKIRNMYRYQWCMRTAQILSVGKKLRRNLLGRNFRNVHIAIDVDPQSIM